MYHNIYIYIYIYKSSFYWPLHHPPTQPSHLQVTTSPSLQNPPHVSCVSPQTLSHSNHLSLFFIPRAQGVGEPPLPLLLDKDKIDSRCYRGRLEYLMDWEGYGLEERSWVHREDILDPALLTSFHQENPNHPAPRSRGRPRRQLRRRVPRPSGA